MEKDNYAKGDFSSRDAQDQAGTDQDTLADQISSLEQRVGDIENKRINIDTDVFGLFETVSAVPAGIPQTVYDQVKIYVNGATLRLYWYDSVAHVWHYVTATA